MMPMISVLMPVYNAATYVRHALNSISNQTLRDIEIVVVDDGSSDRSRRIVRQCASKDSRIRLISRPNTGIVGALNDGLAECRSEFIARMDADDWSHPERLEWQLTFMRTHPEVVACGTSAWIIDPSGRRVGQHRPPLESSGIEENLLRGNGGSFLHPSMMVRTKILLGLGGYNQDFDLAEDLDLYFRLLQKGRIGNLSKPLIHYRQHPASTNFQKRKSQRKLIQQILNRERRFRNLPPYDISSSMAPSDLSRSALYRRWSCGAFDCGYRRTAILHAGSSILRAPLDRLTWQTLKYVMFTPLPDDVAEK